MKTNYNYITNEQIKTNYNSIPNEIEHIKAKLQRNYTTT